MSPSLITGDSLRPDLLLLTGNKVLYILELTLGFETNIQANSVRKANKYTPGLEVVSFDKVTQRRIIMKTINIRGGSREKSDQGSAKISFVWLYGCGNKYGLV